MWIAFYSLYWKQCAWSRTKLSLVWSGFVSLLFCHVSQVSTWLSATFGKHYSNSPHREWYSACYSVSACDITTVMLLGLQHFSHSFTCVDYCPCKAESSDWELCKLIRYIINHFLLPIPLPSEYIVMYRAQSMFRAQSQGVTISLLGIVIAFQLYKKFSLKGM